MASSSQVPKPYQVPASSKEQWERGRGGDRASCTPRGSVPPQHRLRPAPGVHWAHWGQPPIFSLPPVSRYSRNSAPLQKSRGTDRGRDSERLWDEMDGSRPSSCFSTITLSLGISPLPALRSAPPVPGGAPHIPRRAISVRRSSQAGGKPVSLWFRGKALSHFLRRGREGAA